MNHYVLITGASRGIGAACAEVLASPGTYLLLCGNRNPESLEKIRNIAEEKGAVVTLFTGDLADSTTVTDLFETVKATFPRLDVLINNAGISRPSLVQDSSDEESIHLVSVNYLSFLRCSKEAVKLMIPEHSGRIINVSSVFGSAGASYEAEYSASKGAVNALTKSLAKELAPSGITVNAVLPGAIDTEMNRNLSEEERAALCDEIPLGRYGRPEEVAELIRYLAFDAPEYLTGALIPIDGAWI